MFQKQQTNTNALLVLCVLSQHAVTSAVCIRVSSHQIIVNDYWKIISCAGNGQQERGNGQGMDSKREGMDREWTAREREWTGNGQGMDREMRST